MIGILRREGRLIEAVIAADARECLGINDRRQLAQLAAVQRGRILDRLMTEGVTVLDPASTYVDDTVTVGPDTVLYPGVTLEGATSIGAECVIGTGSQIAAEPPGRQDPREALLRADGGGGGGGRPARPLLPSPPARTWGRRPRSATSWS